MVGSSSPDITPKEEPVTLDRPESPNLFLPATQVEFTFDEITFTTNNEVALIYPLHPNQEYFMAVSDFISKCCLKEAFTRAPNQYKEYLSKFWYTVKEDLIHNLNKKNREEIVPYPRFISLLLKHMALKYNNEELTINPTQVFSVYNWILKPNQPEEPPFTDHMKAICNLDVPMDTKAPKYSSPTEEVPQDKTKSAGDGLKTAHTDSGASKKSKTDEISMKIKLYDLSDLLKDTRFAFFTPDSPTDEPLIVLDESEEQEVEKAEQPPATYQDKKELEHQKAAAEAETASLKAKPSYPDINQLTTLLVTSLKLELVKLLASLDFASYLPTKLKELPSKVTKLSKEIKELKQHVKDIELELPGDLKEIPSKLETFTSIISSLSSKVAELKNIQCLLKKVSNTLIRFSTLVENALGATTMGVPSAYKATASPAEGENDADTNLKMN
ncbi:hypothetical protein Tco_1506884 [Tanacetum coccineum]